ncbi:hypothetical protein BURMUCF1_3238 [Burkholderia multivorans ATCC BAA-247]|nr:hypothetical protein BURMUCF1_3238 [Burkholderia multivorans ATCC BAA-247]
MGVASCIVNLQKQHAAGSSGCHRSRERRQMDRLPSLRCSAGRAAW